MAHFAQLNENNEVIQVIVVGNQDCKDVNGNESEEVGINFCKGLLGGHTNWKQTSYNNNFRKRYAGIGYVYNAELDAFIPPKPYPSWTMDTQEANWVPPVPRPSDEGTGDPPKMYTWNEETIGWDLFVPPTPPSE